LRAMRTLRVPAAIQIAAGTLILALPPAAAAAVVSDTPTTPTTPTPTQAASKAATPDASHTGSSHRVRSRLAVPARMRAVLTGSPVAIRGRLLPADGGHVVHLMRWGAHGWQQLAWSRTGRRGGFLLRSRAASTGSTPLKVTFAGDGQHGGASAAAGTLVGLEQTVASWYDDAGNTACGFHAYYGVANKTLPCGTHVTLAYGGRTVVATVDDRGPFVAGRDYDLNQNVAATLGMHGVATVEAAD
jgi:rare lipoprotein A